MSEHPPQHTPEHPPEENPSTDPAHALETNTVPPTPEPPHDEVEAARERLATHSTEDGDGHEQGTDEHGESEESKETDTKKTTPAPVAKTSGHGTSEAKMKLPGWIGVGFALFSFVMIHWVWEPVKHGFKDFSIGKGGGGGGGHKKDDHGHGGGGHGH